MKKNINMIVLNPKGGAGKTTTAGIIASYTDSSTLIEIDRINSVDNPIDPKGLYELVEIDFKDETSDGFLDFQDILLRDGVKIIDVGVIMVEDFQKAMIRASLYDLIDLIIIPAMDGRSDFSKATDLLETMNQGLMPSSKIMIAFSRHNEHEYSDIPDQFRIFFKNKVILKKEYGIDLDDESIYFALKDSKAVKKADEDCRPLRSYLQLDIEELTQRQRSTDIDDKERKILTRERTDYYVAKSFETDYIKPMLLKIEAKLK